MLSELTLTVMRLGLLALLWVFVFAVVGVLRGDLYGTRVKRRATSGRAAKAAARGASPGPAEARRARTTEGPPARPQQGPHPLTVTDGPLSGTTPAAAPAGTLIGRSPECALVLDDDYASRPARPHLPGRRRPWRVEDLGSTNGTFLGATRLTEPREVAVGSVLRIGQTVVELQR